MRREHLDQSRPGFEPPVTCESRPADAPSELRTVRVTEFARRIGVCRATFDCWRKKGVIPDPIDLPGHPRWLESAVDRFIRERSAQPRRFFGSVHRFSSSRRRRTTRSIA